MQASLLNVIFVHLQNEDMNRQCPQDIDDFSVFSFQFWVLNNCHYISRQMESVQKKNGALFSTQGISNIVYEKLHKLNAEFKKTPNLQLVPRLQNLALGIVIHISVLNLLF